MILLKSRMLVALGVLIAVAGLLAFSVSSPSIVTGQETDVEVPGDTGGPEGDVDAGGEEPAAPPASLPQTGNGGYAESAGAKNLLPAMVLVALGVTLAGGGLIAVRYGRRVTKE